MSEFLKHNSSLKAVQKNDICSAEVLIHKNEATLVITLKNGKEIQWTGLFIDEARRIIAEL